MSLTGKYMAKDICVSKNERFVSYRTGEAKTGHDGLLSRCPIHFRIKSVRLRSVGVKSDPIILRPAKN